NLFDTARPPVGTQPQRLHAAPDAPLDVSAEWVPGIRLFSVRPAPSRPRGNAFAALSPESAAGRGPRPLAGGPWGWRVAPGLGMIGFAMVRATQPPPPTVRPPFPVETVMRTLRR